MSEWTTEIRPGYRTKIIQRGSATIIIHRPELTEAEAKKRERRVKEVLAASLKDSIHRTREATT